MALMDNDAGFKPASKTSPQEVYSGLVARGVPPVVAAGMVGNIAGESNFQLGVADGRGEGSVGLIQARGPRLASLRDLGASTGRNPLSLDNQLDHIVTEFQGPEKRAYQLAQDAKTPGEAAYVLAKHYERPADWALRESAPKRMSAAEQVFRQADPSAAAVSTEPTPEADMPAADAVPTSGFRTGAMANPYTPEEEGWNVPVGNTISAIGQALLSGTRQSPLANLPQIMTTQKALADKREDRRYGMYRDSRDFGFRQTESDRAQANADRGYDLSKLNTTADNTRADAALELQRTAAGAPKIMTDGSGAVLAVKPDGTGVTTLAPGQKIQTESGKVAERRAIAKEYGLEEGTPAHSQYLLNGKLPDGATSAPTTKTIKQADGSEVAVQWDATGGKWVPLTAPEGGNPVRPGGAKLTEGQSKDLGFFNRGSAAMDNLQKHEEALKSGPQTTLGNVPVIGNMLTSENYKLGNQAGREFLAAILRKDSGGAITEDENKGYGKIFLPQPGDTPAVLDQKRESRRIAIESIRDGLGTAQALARVAPKGDAPTVRTSDEYNALAPGAAYTDPFGKKRVKGGAQ